MSNINIKSDMGGGNPLNIIRLMSYKIYNDVILTGTLNDNISSSSFNWNRSTLSVNLQNNATHFCLVFRHNGEQVYYDKDTTAGAYYFGTRLIIEFKE